MRYPRTKAVAVGVGGLAFLLLGLGIDPRPAKVLAEAAGTVAIVGSPLGLGITYLKYKA